MITFDLFIQCEEFYNEEHTADDMAVWVKVLPICATYLGDDFWLGTDKVIYKVVA